MKYGVIITGGPLHEQVAAAQAAEAAGWDGVFTWDGIHLGDELEVYDPWVLMAAFAAATRRVRLGAILMPLCRWRSWRLRSCSRGAHRPLAAKRKRNSAVRSRMPASAWRSSDWTGDGCG